jgi:cyclopropane-fatty-acyl-phospholipid synthase
MMYSSAVFPDEKSSLEDASLNKLDRICKKLHLTADDHLIEIGTGWGGLAIHAAKNYGCKVTTTTISKEQREFALKRIAEEGLQDKITVLFSDYRDLEGQYDKLVSIEMIEAVGHEYYRSYFEKCASLLKPDGLMLIQAITIPDQRYDMARKSVDFIQRYIFPGGCLPSVAVIADHVRNYTDLSIIGLEDITEHYARTLAAWRDRFTARLDHVSHQGFDDIFVRMWEFYLCYCEGGFRERSIGTAQIVFAKPGCRVVPVLGAL